MSIQRSWRATTSQKETTCIFQRPAPKEKGFHGGITGSNPVGAARPTVERLTDDNVIEHVDFQNPGSFGQPESQPDTARAELVASDPDLKAAALVQGVRRRFVVLDCLSRARVRL
jgi:hypothetical protein